MFNITKIQVMQINLMKKAVENFQGFEINAVIMNPLNKMMNNEVLDKREMNRCEQFFNDIIQDDLMWQNADCAKLAKSMKRKLVAAMKKA
ncbi:hypothetical protein [Aeromonas phage 50AhydR13PP]|uniref:Uncharacterized protein n=1 Tax=Aeromonas phage 50AhydR13PP TaxID=2163978 RepID=A0A2S1PE95_9CAUD|nr:hypothetical protein KNT90_gp128 [Aeromonas phage 50AhydR13PP]AWH14875.1 hypothetical protein [Aeromonas phage 50AhydR13PP]UIW12963.1 hypothetical protein Ah13A_027 [Aeromonas phage AhMtk13a]